MANLVDVVVPDVGEDDVEIIEICVEVGQTVQAEDAFVTVESDKASMDIPVPFDGVIKEISVKVGDKIKQGDVLGKAEEAGGESTEAPAPSAPPAQAEPQVPSASPEPSASSAGGSEVIEVVVPDIGDATDVEIIEMLVSEGDEVAEEDGLITLETDKATMDVPAPKAGKVVSLKVKTGDKVSEGSLILTLSTGASGSAPEAAPAHQPSQATESAAPAKAAGTSTIEVTVPDIGGDTDVDVIEVLVAEGDSVQAEDGLITLETDKATMDVPAPQAGVVKSLKIKVGDKVSEGSLVLMLEVEGDGDNVEAASAPSAPAPAQAAPEPAKPAPAAKAPPVPHHPSAGEKAKTGVVHASPSVRRLAREFGVDLTLVQGSGRKNRIVKEDVQSYVKYELSRPKIAPGAAATQGAGGLQVIAQPKVDFSKFGEIEVKPLTRIQKLSGPNLHRNWVTIPHVTQFEEADITDLEDFRKQQNAIAEKRKLGVKITPLVFMMKAVADALKQYPTFNTSLSEDGESLIHKKYYHIGIAVDTPGGLVVPVVRDVDKKGVMEISKELMEISVKARDGKLKSADMQGSCFTISSLGGIGGTAFTPIVNAPDVAILGVSKSEIKPKWDGKAFQPRLMLPLSLSYDHRVIDGALAARFAVHLGECLADIRRILL
ncbi:pyruvate dehydrogenase complex dihydrolipoyllysine-residue acetyltransferase [Glaciecola sp. XM2]|uniref:pyruvate dehydrogenase complex dihydrolipoyllysine-residue acetyltransferase n=1 Tax=Glaciecola sp. XM2 TaxID=1914931 RepID=UPI001BDEBC81|nr:pyruvate dehydrogenase complex dihydrolipoyllysine-residue acetyltransferase [Glaciecola sp. XM2]MBT1450534.1 pyruvate dehydrogenase complex dihydrolipoyllysine-residue acetyltransferase [Glaciecola sp. XM2]